MCVMVRHQSGTNSTHSPARLRSDTLMLKLARSDQQSVYSSLWTLRQPVVTESGAHAWASTHLVSLCALESVPTPRPEAIPVPEPEPRELLISGSESTQGSYAFALS